MQVGMIGLGRMGANLVRRLLLGGHECVVYDQESGRIGQLLDEGARGASAVSDLLQHLSPPRVVWLMLPAGSVTEELVSVVAEGLAAGDIIIDGGNSYFKDDIRRAQALQPKGIHYLDVGTSGGVWGLERGYCLMIGGPEAVVRQLEPIFRSLAPGRDQAAPTPGRTSGGTAEHGYVYCGPTGAGHFVKMIHNGIEYGLMQAYAEGFDILRSANQPGLPEDYRYEFNLADIAEVWRRGSVVSSWLLDLTATALAESPELEAYSGLVEDSGEGRWTVMTAVEEAVPAQVLSAALSARFRSRRSPTFADKLLSAMRRKFGGHDEGKPKT
ncbi:MAG: decarboxylating 6-phosphogluconate dehydrogenase [Desulfurellaceae bacterium]|nr:decarboxylating 6-phosphogluconate dehydrogenase [Desulfurellaceae bacterium]